MQGTASPLSRSLACFGKASLGSRSRSLPCTAFGPQEQRRALLLHSLPVLQREDVK